MISGNFPSTSPPSSLPPCPTTTSRSQACSTPHSVPAGTPQMSSRPLLNTGRHQAGHCGRLGHIESISGLDFSSFFPTSLLLTRHCTRPRISTTVSALKNLQLKDIKMQKGMNPVCAGVAGQGSMVGLWGDFMNGAVGLERGRAYAQEWRRSEQNTAPGVVRSLETGLDRGKGRGRTERRTNRKQELRCGAAQMLPASVPPQDKASTRMMPVGDPR